MVKEEASTYKEIIERYDSLFLVKDYNWSSRRRVDLDPETHSRAEAVVVNLAVRMLNFFAPRFSIVTIADPVPILIDRKEIRELWSDVVKEWPENPITRSETLQLSFGDEELEVKV